MIETYEDRNEKKINIGMNLKSNKRNEEVIVVCKIFFILYLITYFCLGCWVYKKI